ncbi:MAG: hypothetical protein AB7F79_10725 [Steroidobacteraceae bacterium]
MRCSFFFSATTEATLTQASWRETITLDGSEAVTRSRTDQRFVAAQSLNQLAIAGVQRHQ